MKLQPGLREQVRLEPLTPLLRPPSLRSAGRLWRHRASFVGPVLLLPLLGICLAASATAGASLALRLPLLILLGANLFYLALTGWPGVLGLAVRAAGRALRVEAKPSGSSRTALVMPIYNEDPAIVFAAVRAMARAVAASSLTGADLFVLSDTRDVLIAAKEEAEYAALRTADMAGLTIRYRRRLDNTRRKVGNIAEFCARWGAHYDYMVVLDADSIMAPSAISRLIGLLDANPHVGIIQSVPYPVGCETVFGRVQQFAARFYTSPLVEGLTWWQQGDGNYWGHNAIIRIAPFVAHCELPVLPGREPWGGEILCHDVVEAGLMRGAGYDVWVLPEVMESFEGLPTNLVDYTARERRWCQGNLQHTALLRHRGLRPVGRFHLGYGVLHYVAAAFVAAFLAVGTADLWLGGGTLARLRPGSGAAASGLLALTLFLLYGAKVLAVAATLLDRAEARRYGGRGRVILSALLEQAAAFVVTPVLIVFAVRYLLELVLGRTVRWDAQARDNRGVSWREGLSRMRTPFLVGLGWLALLAPLGAEWLAWASPLLAGLLLSVPAAVLGSRKGLGRALGRAGLLVTPEEARPPAIVRSSQLAAEAAMHHPLAGAYPSSAAAAVSAAAIRRGTSGLVQT